VLLKYRLAGFALAAVAIVAACTSNGETCTCAIEQGGEHTEVACGATACVGGVEFTCADDQTVSQHDGCSEGTPGPIGTGRSSASSAGGIVIDAGGSSPPDTSCSDLLNYCNSACQSPADVAAGCLSAASSNDPAQCQSWQSSNGILCQP
jgi:hypothetical protein